MDVTLTIPEDIARDLRSANLLPERAALEGLAAEGYRSGALSETQLMCLLQLPSRFAVHRWLANHNVPYRYTEADLAADLAALTELGLR